MIHVSAGPAPNTFIIETQIGEDVREDVTKLVVTRGMGLLELSTQAVSLEDVFKVLTKPKKPVG